MTGARRLARRKLLVCLLMGVLPMAIRLAALPGMHFPQPMVTDEFSYLLGADTFASGRWTNPQHPMWTHFETYSVLSYPTYSSRYPPGQAFFLAIGQKFLGHPWFGVWLSFGLLCTCLCWMLQGWMPPLYAFLGTLVAMGQIGIFGYWMETYWGGALAAAGGCLVLGAVPRLAQRSSLSAAVLGSLGVTILAFSRPLEGLVIIAGGFVTLLVWTRRRGRKLSVLLVPRVIAPVALIGAMALAAMAYDNYRVTGNPLLLPYVLFERIYSRTPLFLFMPIRQITSNHNDVMRGFWDHVAVPHFLLKRRQPWRNVLELQSFLTFYVSGALFFTSVVAVLFSNHFKVKAAGAMLAPLFLTLLMEEGPHAHYLAPGCGLLFVISMYGIRFLSARLSLASAAGRRMGPALLLVFVFAAFGQNVFAFFGARHSESTPRAIITNELTKSGGRHLVLVHYNPAQLIHFEYVYNSADIDRSPVVWAYDMGEEKNRELVNYYSNRKVWLLQTDLSPSSLTPYPAGENPAAGERSSAPSSASAAATLEELK
jgi:hypothetical protein